MVVPLLDVILGRDLRNPPEEPEAGKGAAAAASGSSSSTAGAARAAAGDGGFRRVLYAYVPCHYLVLLGVCHLLSAHAATMHPLAFAGERPAGRLGCPRRTPNLYFRAALDAMCSLSALTHACPRLPLQA